uniref:Matrix-remodeling-associated protein 7 helical domain-containing protein n=1 Tax=Romanomermis culicivorax TaxID=13658 RepID=A0A915KRQ5_ROMCU
MGNLSSKIIIYERLDNISSKFDNKKRKIFSKFSTKKVAEKSDDDDDASGSVRRQQMEQIFRLMKEQEEKLGIVSPDDVVEQMKLYAL